MSEQKDLTNLKAITDFIESRDNFWWTGGYDLEGILFQYFNPYEDPGIAEWAWGEDGWCGGLSYKYSDITDFYIAFSPGIHDSKKEICFEIFTTDGTCVSASKNFNLFTTTLEQFKDIFMKATEEFVNACNKISEEYSQEALKILEDFIDER